MLRTLPKVTQVASGEAWLVTTILCIGMSGGMMEASAVKTLHSFGGPGTGVYSLVSPSDMPVHLQSTFQSLPMESAARIGRGAGSSSQPGLGAVWKDRFLPPATCFPLTPAGRY